MHNTTRRVPVPLSPAQGALGLLLALSQGLTLAAPVAAATAVPTVPAAPLISAVKAPAVSLVSKRAVRPASSPDPAPILASSPASGPARNPASSRAPNPAAAVPERTPPAGPRCTGEAARPASMTLVMGKSTLMRLPEPVIHRSVGNARIAQAMLVAPDTLYLLGIDVGTTNMIIQGRSGGCSMVDMTVVMDPAALQATLAAALPDEKNITVMGAAETFVLTGSVSDATAVARAGELAVAFVRKPLRALIQEGDDAGTPGKQVSKGEDNTIAEKRIVNMLSVSAPQQVMLEVKIAEVSKSLLEKLEGTVSWRSSSGSWAANLMSNFLSGMTGATLRLNKTNGSGVGIGAQKEDGLVRILAEPNVMAVSGQEGSFLAGGRIFIPVAQDNNKITLEEREFGVGLKFTPTVLSGGRINLRVAPEVSEISREGIGISLTGMTANAVLPLITTRRASTTVQLYDGQSFAIGGLIKNNMISNLKGLPGLGEVPVLGALFRSADYQQDRTELVFVVTAHLVKPLPPNYTLPTDGVTIPGRGQFLLGGKQEGPVPASSSASGAGGVAAAPSGTPAAEATPAAALAPATAPAQTSVSGFVLK